VIGGMDALVALRIGVERIEDELLGHASIRRASA
jgi:hypothetical protein